MLIGRPLLSWIVAVEDLVARISGGAFFSAVEVARSSRGQRGVPRGDQQAVPGFVNFNRDFTDALKSGIEFGHHQGEQPRVPFREHQRQRDLARGRYDSAHRCRKGSAFACDAARGRSPK